MHYRLFTLSLFAISNTSEDWHISRDKSFPKTFLLELRYFNQVSRKKHLYGNFYNLREQWSKCFSASKQNRAIEQRQTSILFTCRSDALEFVDTDLKHLRKYLSVNDGYRHENVITHKSDPNRQNGSKCCIIPATCFYSVLAKAK